MTVVEGQVETLKKLKNALRDSGITRFNSVGELNRFQQDFERELQMLPEQVEQQVAKEIEDAVTELEKAREARKADVNQVRAEEELMIRQAREKSEQASSKAEHSFFPQFLPFA